MNVNFNDKLELQSSLGHHQKSKQFHLVHFTAISPKRWKNTFSTGWRRRLCLPRSTISTQGSHSDRQVYPIDSLGFLHANFDIVVRDTYLIKYYILKNKIISPHTEFNSTTLYELPVLGLFTISSQKFRIPPRRNRKMLMALLLSIGSLDLERLTTLLLHDFVSYFKSTCTGVKLSTYGRINVMFAHLVNISKSLTPQT